MFHFRTLVLLVLLCCATLAAALPEVLIWQRLEPTDRDSDPNVMVALPLANAFDEEGRVISIIWSLSDPVFRASVEARKIVEGVENPTEPQVRAGAKALKVTYLVIVSAIRKDGDVVAQATLVRPDSGNVLWSDSKKMTITVGGLSNTEATTSSLARTWTALLAAGPFKNHPARPTIETPPPDPGLIAPDPKSSIPISTKVTLGAEVYERAETLMKQGLTSEAVLLLRDAIDTAPIDPKPRIMLIDMLTMSGHNELAAREARRAGHVLPDSNEFRLMAARSWMEADMPDEAQADLNDALAHAADSPLTHVLRGDVLLAKGEPEKAVEPYTIAIEKQDSFDARFGRALSRGLSGDAEGCSQDLGLLMKVSDTERGAAYARSVRLLDRFTTQLGEELRQCLQAAHSKPGDVGVVDRVERARRNTASLLAFIEGFTSPSRHEQSHAQRTLAYALLVQAASECRSFAESADDQTGGDAAISLGEALKQLPMTARQFEAELTSK